MSTTAQSVIRRAAERLQDPASVRWDVGMLTRFLNDGQMLIATDRPDSVMVIQAVSLVVGAKQTIPADAAQLSDVAGNTVSKVAVRKTESALLDAVEPAWQGRTGSLVIKHFVYDLRYPRDYYVYPPALAGAQLDLVYPRYPVVINEPAAGLTYTAVTGNLTVADQWANALLDYVLSKAWSVDAEFGGNPVLADKHVAMFEAALKEQIQSATAVAATK